MLTATDLQSMRAALQESLPETVTIQRLTRASDGMGGFNETWAQVASVPGRLSPAGTQPTEGVVASVLQSQQAWIVTLPAGTAVTAADRLQIGSRTFEVIGVQAPRSYEIATRIVAVEVSGT